MKFAFVVSLAVAALATLSSPAHADQARHARVAWSFRLWPWRASRLRHRRPCGQPPLAAVPTQVEGPRGQAPQYSFGFAERMPEETTAKNHMGPGFDADYLGANSPGPASYKVSRQK